MSYNLFQKSTEHKLVDTHLSFFTDLKDEKANPISKFGEWFFNFKQEEYQLRQDDKASKIGHEVVKLNPDKKESKAWNLVRGLLCITGIVPLFALAAKLAHRIQFNDLHENKLPDKFRNEEGIFLVPDTPGGADGDIYQGQFEKLRSMNSLKHIHKETYMVLVRQPAPWIEPGDPWVYQRNEKGEYEPAPSNVTVDKLLDKTNDVAKKRFGKIIDPNPVFPDKITKNTYWRGILDKEEVKGSDTKNGFFYDKETGKFYVLVTLNFQKYPFEIDEDIEKVDLDNYIPGLIRGHEQVHLKPLG